MSESVSARANSSATIPSEGAAAPTGVGAGRKVMGVATVGLLHHVVRRTTGSVAAGLLAGTAMALTPVAVLMFRFNNPDALLVLLLTLAGYALIRALEKGSGRWLAVVGVLIGFAFLTKMLQALLVVPAFAVVYLATDLRRAGETDRRDVGRRDDRLADDRAAPHHQVEDPARQPGVLEDPDQLPGAARHELRRLDHHRVTERQRRRHLPGRDGDREVPRGDEADHADRLARHLGLDARPGRGELLSRRPDAFAGEEQEDLRRPHRRDGP